MIFHELILDGSYIIESEPFKDERGLFERLYCKSELTQIGLKKDIVQINHSITNKKGAIRGMHFQYPSKVENKIVRCIRGSVYDVLIDLRKSSKTFLKWHGEVLTDSNMRSLFIPEGFAHGFQALTNKCELLYFHTEFYDRVYESGIRYDDPAININWLLKPTDISNRDIKHEMIDINRFGVNL